MSETIPSIKTKTLSTQTDLQDAFLLHKHAYRESSLVLDIFTRSHGRIALMAKGAKRANSALRPVLADFQPLSVSWRGTGELPTLTHAEWRHGLWRLSGKAVMMGYYLNELVIKFLMRDDPHPALFDLYQTTIAQLSDTADAFLTENEAHLPHLFSQSLPPLVAEGASAPISPHQKNNWAALLRRFEWKLLCEMGYGFDLSTTALGTPVEPDRYYRVAPTLGVMDSVPAHPIQVGDAALLNVLDHAYTAASDDDPADKHSRDALSNSVEEFLPQLINGSALLALSKGIFPSSDILNSLRELLRHLLLFHNDQKPFLTRQVLHDLQST